MNLEEICLAAHCSWALGSIEPNKWNLNWCSFVKQCLDLMSAYLSIMIFLSFLLCFFLFYLVASGNLYFIYCIPNIQWTMNTRYIKHCLQSDVSSWTWRLLLGLISTFRLLPEHWWCSLAVCLYPKRHFPDCHSPGRNSNQNSYPDHIIM